VIVLRGQKARDMLKALKMKASSKFGATGSRCFSGHYHPSKGEASRCDCLTLMQKGGVISGLEINPSIPLWLGRRYKADFRYIETSSGRLIVEDFKGAMTRDWLLVKKAWPNYGVGWLREVHSQGPDRYFTKCEIAGKVEK
jgi:hypothetical protein